MKRVSVYLNGTVSNGHIIGIRHSISFRGLMAEICNVFGIPELQILFTASGCRLKDCSLIRDDETLYVSKGEDFIPPMSTLNPRFETNSSGWVKLNVGGTIFLTTRATLTNGDPNSMLAKMFDPNSGLSPDAVDSNGAYLIDRNPIYFGPILNFLRCGTLIIDEGVNPQGVAAEAQFFGIRNISATAQKTQIDLIKELHNMVEKLKGFEGIKIKVETLKLKLEQRKVHIQEKGHELARNTNLDYPHDGADLESFQSLKNDIKALYDSMKNSSY